MVAEPTPGPAGETTSVGLALPGRSRIYVRADGRRPSRLIAAIVAHARIDLRNSDALVALIMTAASLAVVIRPGEAVDLLAGLLAGAGAICLAWRRNAPRTVLFISGGCLCLYEAMSFPHRALPLPALVAVYTVAANTGVLMAAVASGVLVAGSFGSLAARTGPPGDLDDLFVADLLAVGAACALGYAVQLSRARHQMLRDQATMLTSQHAAHEQQVLRQEHARIAREMHDVIAHQVSVITALATGAKRITDRNPELARDALDSIEVAGREALAEMRLMLRVLRADSDALTPQPSLDQLPALAAHTETAGLPVRLAVRGERRALPAGVELCAYRIVQEALTNTLKHAGPCRATIQVTYHPAAVELDIFDDGRGMPSVPGTGHGLIGMQERAALVGGRLAVGNRPSGGVQVHAWLPAGGDRP